MLPRTRKEHKGQLLGYPGFKPRIETGPREYEVKCVDHSSMMVKCEMCA